MGEGGSANRKGEAKAEHPPSGTGRVFSMLATFMNDGGLY